MANLNLHQLKATSYCSNNKPGTSCSNLSMKAFLPNGYVNYEKIIEKSSIMPNFAIGGVVSIP